MPPTAWACCTDRRRLFPLPRNADRSAHGRAVGFSGTWSAFKRLGLSFRDCMQTPESLFGQDEVRRRGDLEAHVLSRRGVREAENARMERLMPEGRRDASEPFVLGGPPVQGVP